MKVAFIINGKLKKLQRVYNDVIRFEQSQLAETVNSFETKHVGHGIELAKEAAKGHHLLVAVGGDGTLNEVLNGLVQSRQNQALTMLPYGTANDFSRTLGMTNKIQDLIDLVSKQSIRPIDIGKVEFFDESVTESSRYFINVADLGIGGYVVEKVAKSNKTFGPKFTFMKAIFESFLTYEQSKVKVTGDDFEWEGNLLSMAISNGRYYGSGIQIAADANPHDGVFNVTIFSDISTRDYIRHINKIRKGQRVDHPGLHYHRTTSLTVEPSEMSCPLDLDGEFVGFAPAKISILPKGVNMLMPVPDTLDFL